MKDQNLVFKVAKQDVARIRIKLFPQLTPTQRQEIFLALSHDYCLGCGEMAVSCRCQGATGQG